MRRSPTVYDLLHLCGMVAKNDPLCEVDGAWVPARPMGYFGLRIRLRAAWLAFTGRGDVVIWPQDRQP